MANRCPNCGKFLSAKDTVCSNCGAVLGAAPAKVEAPKVEAPKEEVKVETEVIIDEERVSVEPAPDVIKEGSAPIIITRYENVPVRMEADLSGPSYFDGRWIQYVGWSLLGGLVTLFTLGVCYPLAYGWLARWEAKHTVTAGYRQVWKGSCGGLIGWWLLWCLLTVITLTIFAWWNPIRFRRWKVSHIYLVKEEHPLKKFKTR